MNTISSKQLFVQVKTRGAELCSIRGTDGTEYVWQADPAFWTRHAPVLFPIVGKLRDGRYAWNGKTFELSPHGFARDLDFSLIEQDERSLTFQLLPSAETRTCYPFEFALTITYRLNGSTLSIEYSVQNNGKEILPFSIGAHPAFNLHGPIEESFLEFEKPETLSARLISNKGLLTEQTVPVLDGSKILPLSKTLFDRDALIFLDAESKKITLGAKHSSRRLTVEFAGFPELGIWAKPGVPFVCIEPWYGYADPEQPYGDITNKPGILKLAAGKTFTCTHKITAKP